MTDFESSRYSKTTTSGVTSYQNFIFIKIIFVSIFININNCINTINMGLGTDPHSVWSQTTVLGARSPDGR